MSTRTEERNVVDRAGTVGVVDVVIPCFNDGAFLLEALESLGPDREKGQGVIIVNDGSTDPGTMDVLAGLRMRGFRVMDRENGGLPSARNSGWRACDAPYVLFLDADNRVEPALLEEATAILDPHPGIAVVYPDKREFGAREGVVAQPEIALGQLLVGNRIDACAVVRREVLERTGGYDEAMRDGYEDWELWIRLMAEGHGFKRIPRPLFHYRVREGSLLSRAADPDQRARILGYITAKHADLFAGHAWTVITELHRIQANDQRLLRDAARVTADAERAASAALRAARDLGDELAALRRTALEDDAPHGASKLALEVLRGEKEALAQRANALVAQVEAARTALDLQHAQATALQALVERYEERIRAIEGSRLWRARRSYHRLRALLRTSSGTSIAGLRWLRRITFLVGARGRNIMRRVLAKLFRLLYLWMETRPVRILIGETGTQAIDMRTPYEQWREAHRARESDLRGYRQDVALLAYRPLISVVMPVFNPPVHALDDAIGSVLSQAYPDLELCIADDRSTDPAVRDVLSAWETKDPRVRVVYREQNGHIAAATNSALAIARGAFVAFMDHDDLLAPDALYHVVKAINRDRTLDVVYTDEDKIDEEGRHSEPHFKPQWCPDHLLSRNYFGHLVVLRASIVREIGGCREGFEGSQDYDMLLRFTERTGRIARVPKVLYHWRRHAGSLAGNEEAKPYAFQAARRALTEACERRGEPAEIGFLDGFRGYSVRFTRPLEGKVSVIIPTKDQTEVLGTCLRSLFELTDHPSYEVVVVSNNSSERGFFALMEEMERAHGDRFKWVEENMRFNFSALMNKGLAHTTGDQILYLNNDTRIAHADWMRTMHEWSQRPSTGAVGVKLLYPNDLIQHAGVLVGLGGVAGHAFTGQHKDGPGYFNYINMVNNYSALTAACLMVQRSKVEAIGGWEEALAVEYNDVDLCLRLREKGWDNVYVPNVTVYHYESLTRGHPHFVKAGYEQHLRDKGFFSERWKAYIADDPCFNPNMDRGRSDFSLAP